MGWLTRFLTGNIDPEEPLPPIASRLAELVATRLADVDPWSLPVVVAGRRLLADTVAMFPMVAVRGADRITPTPNILSRPDPRERYRDTLERTVNDLTRHGGAWFRVDARDSTGYPVAVRLMARSRVNWELTTPQDALARVWFDGVEWPVRDVMYIPLTLDPGPIGQSPWCQITVMLDQLAEVFQSARNYYTWDTTVPPYALKHPTRLTAAQATEFVDQWTEARLLRRVAVLSGGVELEQYTPTAAADMLFWDAIGELEAMVARAGLIPPSLLNTRSQSGSLTYSTTRDELQRFLTLTVQPGYLERLSSAFSDLLPRGTIAVFDTSNLTRMAFADRIDTYATSISAGIHTTAEVRALEGLPASPAAAPVPIEPNVEGL